MSISAISGSASSVTSLSGMYAQRRRAAVNSEDMDTELSTRIMSDKDADGNGLMSLQESGLTEDQFGNIDADGDGSATSDELTTALKSKREEMMSKIKQHFDANPEELATRMSARIMEEQDADGDGGLSLEESGLDDEDYASIDTDGDGSVNSAELGEAVKARHQGNAGGPPPGPPPGGGPGGPGGGQGGLGGGQGSEDVLQSLFGDTATDSDEDDASVSASATLSDAWKQRMQKASSAYQNQAQGLLSALFGQGEALATA